MATVRSHKRKVKNKVVTVRQHIRGAESYPANKDKKVGAFDKMVGISEHYSDNSDVDSSCIKAKTGSIHKIPNTVLIKDSKFKRK